MINILLQNTLRLSLDRINTWLVFFLKQNKNFGCFPPAKLSWTLVLNQWLQPLPSGGIATKIADAFEVSLDFLVGKSSLIVKDESMLERLEDIAALPKP